jgi:hypothetical protein
MKPIAVAASLVALLHPQDYAHAQTSIQLGQGPLDADHFPREAVRAYCKAAVDTGVAGFGGNATNPLPVAWRCAKGEVYTCTPGADGVACSARNRSRIPLPLMIKACASGDFLSLPTGAFGYIWNWACDHGKPVITGPLFRLNRETGAKRAIAFDAQGYAEDEWRPLN